uniref:Uncharacterized protein n=1 Tax=Octopus bimaculoides TaxID=37653 RepID=A0A0L8FXS6_OCTBM
MNKYWVHATDCTKVDACYVHAAVSTTVGAKYLKAAALAVVLYIYATVCWCYKHSTGCTTADDMYMQVAPSVATLQLCTCNWSYFNWRYVHATICTILKVIS